MTHFHYSKLGFPLLTKVTQDLSDNFYSFTIFLETCQQVWNCYSYNKFTWENTGTCETNCHLIKKPLVFYHENNTSNSTPTVFIIHDIIHDIPGRVGTGRLYTVRAIVYTSFGHGIVRKHFKCKQYWLSLTG